MSVSSYTIKYERRLNKWLNWPLKILDKFHSREEELEYIEDGNKIVLFGCHRMGSLILKEFEGEKGDLLVVDYNPEIIKSLIEKKVPCIYGDYMNEEVLEKANLKGAEIIVSTIPEVEDNILLAYKIRKMNKDALIIMAGERIDDALELYKAGADYVILPNVLGGQNAFEIIKKMKRSKPEARELKKEQIKYLNKIHHILY
jgi:voltage-gated potassium channel Kch